MAPVDTIVVIPAYNPGRFLRRALKSVQAQTYEGWRLLVVDDGSTEDVSRHFPPDLDAGRLQLVRHPSNLGQSTALNTALARVETPFLAQLDADDWFLPNTLERLHQYLEAAPPEVALVSANLKTVFSNGRRPLYSRGAAFSERLEFLLANRSVWPRFYRTAALKSVGGWPLDGPYGGRYLEDKQVLYRLIERYRFGWVDETLYVHRRHAHNQTLRRREYNRVTCWAVEEALRRWGGAYHPVFSQTRTGWLKVDRLVPAAPSSTG